MSLKLQFLSLLIIVLFLLVFLDPIFIDQFWVKTNNVIHNDLVAFSMLLLPIFGDHSFSSCSIAPHCQQILNVDDFGAKADGTYDNKAFEKAWEQACFSNDHEGVVLIVPVNKTYNLKPISFSGPCKSALTIKIYGSIRASTNASDYLMDRRHWIVFKHVDNLRVEGGGSFNGIGNIWWNHSCRLNKSLAVTFRECNNLRVAKLRFINAQQKHVTFQKCVNVKALNLRITAPENSPNTDGIHITETHNIHIINCVIKTGDDCISIVRWSRNIRATGITCGPGHGISIGSLGWRNSKDYISNVTVNRAKFLGTNNGVRIKTWRGGSGYAKNIKFENIVMQNVRHPIIIDQNYCDRPQHQEPNACREQASAVHISNVVYKNIIGTSKSKVALKLECSSHFPCNGILLQNVDLRHSNASTTVEASCKNVVLNNMVRRVTPNCSTL